MKGRMSGLDVRVQVASLRNELIGMRLANVYDFSAKTYVFKFQKPEKKVLLLMESGIRFHTTEYSRDRGRERNEIPSGFTMKLRKHIRTRRLEDIQQLGVDRVVDFVFGSGETACHVILELYGPGNIIFTDYNYEILTLLRSRMHDETVRIAVRERFPLDTVRARQELTRARVVEALTSRASEKETLRQAFARSLDIGKELVEHCLVRCGIAGSQKASSIDPENDTETVDLLFKAFQEGEEVIGEAGSRGYIVYKASKGKGNAGGGEDEVKVYDEFLPYLFDQYKDSPVLEQPSFDVAMDEFFSNIESQKLEMQRRQQEDAAWKKVSKVKEDHHQRVQALLDNQASNVTKAMMIEYNLEEVDQAITIIVSAIASQMDWTALKELVKEEQRRGNPIAEIIHNLDLQKNRMTLLLSNNLDDATEADISAPLTKVEVDLSMNAYNNAKVYFSTKKQQAVKVDKTLQATDQAVKAAERKARAQLKEMAIKTDIRQIRKPIWFEKFNWFISSENYVVLSGRDAQQNEILVKRYMKKGDVYVHADIHGASSTIIKNPSGNEVPPLTLSQAGIACVCRSAAWEHKVVTGAYWVYDHQVSKSAPTGEYLTTGSFMIRGKKNFLHPQPLVMGFGFLFKVDEASIARHMGERRVRGMEDGDTESMAPSTVAQDDVSVDSGSEGGEDGKGSQEETPVPAAPAVAEAPNGLVAPAASNAAGNQGPADDAGRVGDGSGESDAGDAAFDYDVKISSEGVKLVRSDSQTASEVGSAPGNRRLTAKERRDLKKARAKEGAGGEEGRVEGAPAQGPAKDKGSGKKKAKDNAGKPQGPVPAAPLPRGKKAKMKRAKGKYDDQSDEERELMMTFLGSEGKKGKKQGKQGKEGSASKAAKDNPPAPQDDSARVCFHCKVPGHVSKDCPQKPKEESGLAPGAEGPGETEDEKKRAGRKEKREMKEQEQQEIKQILEDEGLAPVDDDDKAKLSEVDSLTGIPVPEDTVLYALPMCAPYAVFNNFKYKVKLTPGSGKKGKSAKKVVELFQKVHSAPQREKDLIKHVLETELIAAMMGSVKVSAPGIQNTTSKRKK